MLMRDETNDPAAEAAFYGDDRDDVFNDDLEALGGTTEDLEVSALREMIADAVEVAAEERGSDSYSILRLSGALVDNLDEPLVEELNRTELVGVLRFLARENPGALATATARHPATEDMLTDILVTNGSV